MIPNRLGTRAAILAPTIALVLLVTGCNRTYWTADLTATQGNTAKGEVRFYKVEAGVRVLARVEGLTPGKHGFHIHEKGDCTAPDASSAGGHFNPNNAPHGAPTADRSARHAGDLGNLEAGPDGKARYDRVDTVLDFAQLAGLSVLVHAGEDDFTSQPAGNSGARVACGVIRMK